MEVCSWNWGAIGSFVGAGATLIGAYCAVFISKTWKEQKSAEVLANEAQLLLHDIIALNTKLIEDKDSGKVRIEISLSNISQILQDIESIKMRTILLDKNLFVDLKSPLDQLEERLNKEIFKESSATNFQNNDHRVALAGIAIDIEVSNKYKNLKFELEKLIDPIKEIATFKRIL